MRRPRLVLLVIAAALVGSFEFAPAREPVVFNRWANIEAHDRAPVVYEGDLEGR